MTSKAGVHKCSCNWGDQCATFQKNLLASSAWFGKIRIKAKKGSKLRNLIAKMFNIENLERDSYLARHHWDHNYVTYLKKYNKFATTPFLMKVALEHGFHSSCVPVSDTRCS